jgi:hypothetical protein
MTMTKRSTLPVYLEIGAKRVFAGALEWPGWSRSARDERSALEALAAYGPRYAAAIGRTLATFAIPEDAAGLLVAEQVQGNATTDFGAPSVPPAADARLADEAEAARLIAILQACWTSFDRIAADALGKPLATGPRGGGRSLDAIVRHVVEAEQAYNAALGGRFRSPGEPDIEAVRAATRETVLETLAARMRGDPLPPTRRTRPPWSPRYFVRRAAWHALDHAWEIEDRASAG